MSLHLEFRLTWNAQVLHVNMRKTEDKVNDVRETVDDLSDRNAKEPHEAPVLLGRSPSHIMCVSKRMMTVQMTKTWIKVRSMWFDT